MFCIAKFYKNDIIAYKETFFGGIMAKTFSFSSHSRFVNQFKGKKSKAQETNEFAIQTNYKKNRKKYKSLIQQQENIAKMFEDMKK